MGEISAKIFQKKFTAVPIAAGNGGFSLVTETTGSAGGFRKKALASSIERSELRIAIQQFRMHSIITADAHLWAAEHLMQVKDNSAHL